MGCGPLAAFMIVVLILLMLGSNQAVGYYYGHCQNTDIFDCLFNRLEEPEAEGVVATGSYEYKGNIVNVSATIPLDGGAVTGTVSGACDGTVKATFSGQNNGVISGTMMGTCAPFFVNIPASAEFSGTVNKSSKTVPFSFTGRGGGLTHEGSMSLRW